MNVENTELWADIVEVPEALCLATSNRNIRMLFSCSSSRIAMPLYLWKYYIGIVPYRNLSE